MEELLSLEDLLGLQVVDLEIDRLLNERQSLPGDGQGSNRRWRSARGQRVWPWMKPGAGSMS